MTRLGGMVAGVATVLVLACTEPPAERAAPPSPSTTDDAERSDSTVLETTSAALPGEQLALLSGDKPASPPPPAQPSTSSSARSLSDARAAQINDDLKKLDLQMIAALGSGNSNATDHSIGPGKAAQGLLDSAVEANARGPRPGGLRSGSGGGLQGKAGGGAGLGSLGGTGSAPASTIGGKSPKDITSDDVDKALASAGCSTTRLDSPSQPPSRGAIFEAKCGSRSFVVSFAPAGSTHPETKAIAEMERLGSTWNEGGLFLAIVPKKNADRAAASELMNKLRSPGGKAIGGSRANVGVGGASVSGGTVENAGAVVAGMAAGFRRCFNRALSEDPEMRGSLRITTKIGPNGEVISATTSGGGGLSEPLKGCVTSVVTSRSFSKPDTGSATIVIPVTFLPPQ